ncbi:uncharacterized protein F4822DRAFT_324327 [Hypoxylon trugodes]|uniref:uncharacterized protein n=1 Tax=Hypoxylon trugodes TaxID=326681 RepID=UPI00219F5EA8|nr:uncharacterized protein F4822DRAFT_324327 [Hypoxylon trugodes]KAI1386692.1 hypothetical protein F4822DRAFT_324327 [Hypoxylon trugodes]
MGSWSLYHPAGVLYNTLLCPCACTCHPYNWPLSFYKGSVSWLWARLYQHRKLRRDTKLWGSGKRDSGRELLRGAVEERKMRMVTPNRTLVFSSRKQKRMHHHNNIPYTTLTLLYIVLFFHLNLRDGLVHNVYIEYSLELKGTDASCIITSRPLVDKLRHQYSTSAIPTFGLKRTWERISDTEWLSY